MYDITGLEIETVYYKKMVIRDVNNYISQYEDGKCKLKGLFEIDKELYKDGSMKIVPIALKNYFIDDIPIAQTIKNHTNIFDFCLRIKTNAGFKSTFHTLEDGKPIVKQLSKITRYYISKGGGSIYKTSLTRNSPTRVQVGFLTTIFNQYIEKPMDEYDINYAFYSKECSKIIDIIEDKQLSLF